MKTKSAARTFLDARIGEPMTLGRFLRCHREDEGLSMSEMARALGTRSQRLQAIEDGKGVVSIARAMQWARHLGYVEDLFVQLVLQSQLTAASGADLDSREARRLLKALGGTLDVRRVPRR